ERAREELRRLQVGDQWVQTDPGRPTGTVAVTLRNGEPSYTIADGAAWDEIEPPTTEQKPTLRAARFAALVFGTLVQRHATSRDALAQLRRLLPDVPAFYDINLRPPHTPLDIVATTLPGTSVLKANAEEGETLGRHFYGSALAPADLFARLHAD